MATTEAFDAAYALIQKVNVNGALVLAHAAALPVEERHDYVIRAAAHFAEMRKRVDQYHLMPVDVQTFVESPAFLGRRGIVYPKIMDKLREINSGRYIESVFTGAIGTGKTTAALFSIGYQLYLLSCLKNPHTTFTPPLDPASEILIVFQSLNAKVAKQNDYTRFRSMIANSPYFNEHFCFDKQLESEMIFPNRICVRTLTGNPNAAIGSNVHSAIIDEINFMSVVEKSTQAVDGGTFDQATEMYNGLSRRRKSRFMGADGAMSGLVCLVSSKRYPGEFTERKAQEAAREIKETGRTTIFIYDEVVWNVKPPGSFGPGRFNLFLGDIARKPRVMDDDEEIQPADRHLVMQVPLEFKSEFYHDILSAIRDIAGSSTFAMNPYMVNTDAVAKAFGTRQSILSLPSTDFTTSRPLIYPNRILRPDEPRMCHIDLAISGDSAGVAIGWCEGFAAVPRGDGTSEMMPKINLDLILEVKPPRGGEIEFESIRALLYKLKELGMNLKWVSFDTFQSRDSIQLLRQKGFVTGTVSMDTDSLGYDVTKTAFYDGRLSLPPHDHTLEELIRLERDPATGLIDHPPNGSKDCSDALAGVVYGLTYRRETWVRYGVSMREILTKIADRVADKDKKSNAAARAGLHRHGGYVDIGVGVAR
jgi:hypothetical protein